MYKDEWIVMHSFHILHPIYLFYIATINYRMNIFGWVILHSDKWYTHFIFYILSNSYFFFHKLRICTKIVLLKNVLEWTIQPIGVFLSKLLLLLVHVWVHYVAVISLSTCMETTMYFMAA